MMNQADRLLTVEEWRDCVQSQDSIFWDIREAQDRKTLEGVADWLEALELYPDGMKDGRPTAEEHALTVAVLLLAAQKIRDATQ